MDWRNLALMCSMLFGSGPLLGGLGLEVIGGRPVVDGVFVNGHGPYRFLVDTAATMNHLEPGLARKMGLTATFRTELATSVGVTTAEGMGGLEVAVGAARADGQQFLLSGMDVVHELSSNIQGILGQDFLARFDYLLDLKQKRLEFGRQERNGKKAVFRLLNGRAAVRTNLGELVLDSGAARVVLFGVEPASFRRSRMNTLAGSQIVGMIHRTLAIEGRNLWSGHVVAIPGRNEGEVAGLMPLSLFRAVYISNSEGYVIFE